MEEEQGEGDWLVIKKVKVKVVWKNREGKRESQDSSEGLVGTDPSFFFFHEQEQDGNFEGKAHLCSVAG